MFKFKNILIVGGIAFFTLAVSFFYKSTKYDELYFRAFPMSKEVYEKKLSVLEKDYSRIMSVDYYSKNKKESLENLKKSLLKLKKDGASYANN